VNRLIQLIFSLFLAFTAAAAVIAKGPAYTDPNNTDADFPFQGEYVGAVKEDGIKVGVQVIALGGGKFQSVAYVGGLPGDGWDKEQTYKAEGELKDGELVIMKGDAWGKIKDGVISVGTKEVPDFARFERVYRSSPTEGAKPPAGAIILFDGKSADAFEKGKMDEHGLLMPGCTSVQKFGSFHLHIEFRLPYQPEDRGQARGNSGVYMQGRYEVQMLDSFGLEGKNNECGGLYELRDPDQNMCFPPLAWQTYDIDYTAAEYNTTKSDDDKPIAPPRITVQHNGVVIHNNVALPTDRGTRSSPVKPGPEPGPLYLQDHGSPVRYRNIWLVETK
jgi:hypothetical protein